MTPFARTSCAARSALLGVNVLRVLDYAEEGLATPNQDELIGRLVEPIRMHRPEVILGFGADGITGDADHVAVSRATSQAFDARGRAAGLRG